jgi:hypothetical protein
MKASTEEYYSIRDIVINVKIFTHFLLKRWWMFVLAALLGIVCGYIYYIKQKPRYEALSTFILEDRSSGGGSGLAGLASQFGLNIPSMSGGGSIFSGDNILNILRSKNVVQRVLLTTIEPQGSFTLADSYLQFTGLKKSWQNKSVLASISFSNVNQPLAPLQDSVLNLIYERLIKSNISVDRTSKQGTIIKVLVSAPDRVFARLMTERLVEEASKMYLDIRVGTAASNIKQLENKADSLLVLLNIKSYRVAASQPLDINPGIRTAAVPVEIANRDKTVLTTLYAEVVKNLEASKLILSQQTPVIQVLDRPAYLLDDNKRGLLFVLVVSCFVTGLISIAGCLFAFLLRNTNQTQ